MSDLQCPATLLLARHGEAEYESSVWSDDGGSLTLRGREQARALAEELASARIAHVWTSTMARAVQTGEIVAAAFGVGVTTRSGLREFAVGDFAGTPIEGDPFAPYFARWLAGEYDVVVPGGETGAQVRARFADALQEIADQHRGESALVVSHGGILRSMVPALFRMEATADRTHNCASVDVVIDGDDWVCRRWTPYRSS